VLSKKLTAIIIAGVSICIAFTYTWYVLDLTYLFGPDQSLSILTETTPNLVKKLDMEFKDGWSIVVTNQNKVIVLGVLFAILIGGFVTLAIVNQQISQMTMKFESR
jgi:hypothetical protein